MPGIGSISRAGDCIRLGLALLAGACMVGCAADGARTASSENERAWVLSGAGLSEPTNAALEDPDSLLAVDDAMRDFVHRTTDGIDSDSGKLQALTSAMHAADGLGLRYDAKATLTARQAFAQRRVNCLSHTMLFIALAREIGVDARFNHVEVPPIWDMRDDNFVLYRHVNARIGSSSERFRVVDVVLDEYDAAFPQWIVTDRVAQAEFYNNRAMELLEQNDDQLALKNQLFALKLDPKQSFLWSNLAHLYLTMDNARAAEIAVQTALQLDSDNRVADGTAARVYQTLGKPALARKYQRRAQLALQRNPYYHYQLATKALERGELEDSYEHVRRAIVLYPEDHRFFFLMGVVLTRLDEPDLARKSMEVAIQLSTDEALQQRYRSKLDRLKNAHG